MSEIDRKLIKMQIFFVRAYIISTAHFSLVSVELPKMGTINKTVFFLGFVILKKQLTFPQPSVILRSRKTHPVNRPNLK